MPNNITISSFKKIPIAFIVFILLVIATEVFIYSNRAEIIEDYWNKFLINEHVLVDLPENFDYLIIGDSIQKTGINPIQVDKDILNLGLPGGKPMGLYLLLKRYLEKHKPPKLIFLYVDPEEAHDSLFVILRYFVTLPEFVEICRDLTWEERQVFLLRYWASLDLRKVGLTIRNKYPYKNDVFIKSMIENHGYMPSPGYEKSISDNYLRKNRERIQTKISITATDMKYLDKLMELAYSKNIKVVFLGFLTPEELDVILDFTGFNKDYIAFLNSLKQRYPDAYFDANPILHLENKYFGDVSHVNKAGSEIYTAYFKNQLFLPAVRTITKTE